MAGSFSGIATFAFWMAKQGYSDTTIRATVRTLRAIGKRVSLLEPETVKAHLTTLQVSETRKQKISEDLARFYKYKKIPPIPVFKTERTAQGHESRED